MGKVIHARVMVKVVKGIQRVAGLSLALLLTACGGDSTPVAGAAAAPAADTVYNWRMVTAWPKNLPALGTAPEAFARQVERMSNGRLRIRVYGANELVGGLEVFDAVSRGTAEIGHGTAYYWQGKVPAATFFSGIPFGLTGIEMNAWLAFGGGNELWREVYAPFDLIPVRGGNSGTQMFGWFNKEINSVADLQGLKMRIPGIGGEVFARAGGVPVTMQVSDVFSALETGALDATEWVSPFNDLVAGYHTVARYYYYPGWHEPGSALEALFNKTAFDALPADLQEILLAAAEVMNQRVFDELTARNNEALQTLVNEHQVELRQLPDDVLREFKRLSEEVVQEMAATDATTRRVYESFQQFRTGVSAYHRIAEDAFITARNL